ncbi:methyltransferase domain-containing protein [Rhodanobacter koreensis]
MSLGMAAVLMDIYRVAMPYRLRYFKQCLSAFQTGKGLELGGPSTIFGSRGSIPVYPVAACIDNCNFSGDTVWEGEIREGNSFVFDKRATPGRQYVVEASCLKGIADASYDFVLSSHCIEHLANPLQGLSEWVRVLKDDGLLVLVVPHKDGTFDHRRPVTTLAHMIQDFDARMQEDDMTHLDEILRLHDLRMDYRAGDLGTFRDRSRRNFENRCLHQHVFDTRLAVEMVDHMGLQLLAVEAFRPMHIALIARKLAHGLVPQNAKFIGETGTPIWRSPFPSDRRYQRRGA